MRFYLEAILFKNSVISLDCASVKAELSTQWAGINKQIKYVPVAHSSLYLIQSLFLEDCVTKPVNKSEEKETSCHVLVWPLGGFLSLSLSLPLGKYQTNWIGAPLGSRLEDIASSFPRWRHTQCKEGVLLSLVSSLDFHVWYPKSVF